MTLLITSFTTWKAHQTSNASDDLLVLLQKHQCLPTPVQLIRHLPVHFQLAPAQAIAALYQHRPATVVCCGMAETRSRLNLEQYAYGHRERLATSIDLKRLTAGLQYTDISHDAGNFVCNHLYYELLSHISKQALNIQALFVHVPPLSTHNAEPIMADMASVLMRLSEHTMTVPAAEMQSLPV